MFQSLHREVASGRGACTRHTHLWHTAAGPRDKTRHSGYYTTRWNHVHVLCTTLSSPPSFAFIAFVTRGRCTAVDVVLGVESTAPASTVLHSDVR
ncbi:hypothetical protein C0Q70_06526 [Pomacea canaliculata]|uniref:Uncharacterized protein n=1 Tax=Pomacea canaliculata TaxID=400727 RepID=A0A2T7PPB0_POMCA|nr:hypothetical protein C0Q70_06526 [Pomacea canaliculata]